MQFDTNTPQIVKLHKNRPFLSRAKIKILVKIKFNLLKLTMSKFCEFTNYLQRPAPAVSGERAVMTKRKATGNARSLMSFSTYYIVR